MIQLWMVQWSVINAGDISFQFNEQEDMYMNFLCNPTGNIFLDVSRDHEFLLSHIGTLLHASHSSTESRKSNYNYVESLVPTHLPLHKYNPWTPLRNTIQNVNFVDPVQTRRAHETLMNDVNREARYISNICGVQIDPLYFG